MSSHMQMRPSMQQQFMQSAAAQQQGGGMMMGGQRPQGPRMAMMANPAAMGAMGGGGQAASAMMSHQQQHHAMSMGMMHGHGGMTVDGPTGGLGAQQAMGMQAGGGGGIRPPFVQTPADMTGFPEDFF